MPTVFPSVWREPQKVAAAFTYVTGLCESLLENITPALNAFHGERHSARYWRIITGQWLHWYVSAMYDRYVTLTAALEIYPNAEITGLAAESYVVPADLEGFATLVYGDTYNLQLYSRILEFLGRDFKREVLAVRAEAAWTKQTRTRQPGLLRRSQGALMRASSPRPALALKSVYFSKRAQMELIARLPGKLRFLSQAAGCTPDAATDRAVRQRIVAPVPARNAFERLLQQTLPYDIPIAYVEGHGAIAREAQRRYPAPPRAIVSANAWYYDEHFKVWAAAAAETGTLLLGTQHGANYGSQRDMFAENHERRIVDRYYSWGWEATQPGATTVPMPATLLCGRGQLGIAPATETGILYSATTMPRYLVQFPNVPARFVEYLDWQRRFAARLGPGLRSRMRLRPHYHEDGWDIPGRWRKEFSEVSTEDWSLEFWESLRRCRLYVCDHCSTTFAEALAADKPTILFWNPATNEVRAEAEPYYDALRRAGILFDTPEGAAEAVGRVYDRVAQWWYGVEVQAARRQFCDRFARTSKNAIGQWAAELKRVLRDHGHGPAPSAGC